MDFFGAQARARRDSLLLGCAFAACVLAVVLVLGVGVLAAARIGMAAGDHPQPMLASLGVWMRHHPVLVFLTVAGIGGYIGGASFWRMMQLREGGGYVARSLGGIRIDQGARDPRRRVLHNVVEEMAIASGVPCPEVYVLEQEEGINAFAAGHSPANAAIAVTQGALTRLNREQLQGVIGHEFSHVLNGDIRISTRLMGMIHGLMSVALAGRILLRGARFSRKGGGMAVLIGGLLMIVGYVGWLFARVLQAWMSRRREALADASAVQFTRSTDGLAQALVRVAAMGEFRRPANAGMQEVAHMLFAHGARSLFATHPPVLERVRALDPSITAERLESLKRQALKGWQQQLVADAPAAADAPAVAAAAASPARPAVAAGTAALDASLPEPLPGALPALPAVIAGPLGAALIAGSAGEPAPRHLEQAAALRLAIPDALRASAEEPEAAQASLLSMVIHCAPGDVAQAVAVVTRRMGAPMALAVQQRAAVSASLASLVRLPAVLQLVPALRALPPAPRLHFISVLRELMRLDGITVFEYALDKLAVRALLAQGDPRPMHGALSLADCTRELGVVFAVLARHGARDAAQARQCYAAGLGELLAGELPAYAVPDNWVPLFDQSLDRLGKLRIAAKQPLIEALVRTIAHDGLLAPAEAELLRAICAVLECPLPPVLPEPA